jgi:hypothetical protein
MRRVITTGSAITALVLAALAVGPTSAAPQEAVPEAAKSEPSALEKEVSAIGVKWLSLLDGQKYDDSWTKAGTTFRNEVKHEQWVTVLQRLREPLGSAVSRVPARIDLMKTMRGAPDGDYAVIHYTTGFKDKSVTERLTLAKENGKWEVFSYAIH